MIGGSESQVVPGNLSWVSNETVACILQLPKILRVRQQGLALHRGIFCVFFYNQSSDDKRTCLDRYGSVK